MPLCNAAVTTAQPFCNCRGRAVSLSDHPGVGPRWLALGQGAGMSPKALL